MREISVKFMLVDDQEEMLQKITEEYKKQGLNLSENKMFESIMFMGSKHDIDNKFKFHESNLGLRVDDR